MARPRLSVPTYRKHSTGRAVISVYTAQGTRTEILLPGEHGSRESKEEYARILRRLEANDGRMPADKVVRDRDITIAELVLKFMAHAETYYVDPVTKEPTSEIAALGAAVRPLVRMYATTLAVEFGPLALQTLRSAMIDGSWLTDQERAHCAKTMRPIGLARTTCNKNVNRIKLVFKWAASMELVPNSTYQSLTTVAGLRRGRSAARETAPVAPVASGIVEITLPKLPPTVRDMVKILLFTGMRCGELCIMRKCDVDQSGTIWIYRPQRHKGVWRGKERAIAIGPRAQEIIERYLVSETDSYLFSPKVQDELIRGQKRANRKTPLYRSHIARLSQNRQQFGKRRPSDRFTPGAINRAIRRACKRAGVAHWHVHQLRHSASLVFSRELGLEAARAALGHASVDMSAMYAGHDLQRAKEVAAKLG
jgi:integrase